MKDESMLTPDADFDVLTLGHFAKDRLVVDGQGEIAKGGGIYYGGIALRRMGLSVAVVTRLHPDDFPLLAEFKDNGVTVFATPAPATSGIENIYNSADMERRICKPIAFAGPFSPEELPDVTSRVILIASIIAGEVDLPLVKTLAKRAPVGLDVQGFVRVREGDDLVFHPWEDMAEGLKSVTYLKVDRAEAEMLTGETDLRLAAQQLANYGPSEIVITQSAGVMVYAEGALYEAPFTPRSLIGRTGRGDTCFASYVGYRLNHTAEEACRFAAAVTTLKQERPGPWDGELDSVKALLATRAGH